MRTVSSVVLVLGLSLGVVSLDAQVVSPSPQTINAIFGADGVVCSQSTTSKSCASWGTLAYPTLVVQITGTFTGTLTFEGTADGLTWFTVRLVNLTSAAGATTASGTGQFAVINNGLVGLRLRASAWTSGGANITVTRGTATAVYSVS